MLRYVLFIVSGALTIASANFGVKPQYQIPLGETLSQTIQGTYYTTADATVAKDRQVVLTGTRIYIACDGDRLKRNDNIPVRVTYDGYTAKCRFLDKLPQMQKVTAPKTVTYQPTRPHDAAVYSKGNYENLTYTYSIARIINYDPTTESATLQAYKDGQVYETVKVHGLQAGTYTDVRVSQGRVVSATVLPAKLHCNQSTYNLYNAGPRFDASNCL